MSYFVIIQNDTVHFSDIAVKPNGLPYKIPLRALATPWGFMIPMCYNTFSIFDYFEGSQSKLDVFSLMIARNGDVYEYAFDALAGIMDRRRVPIDKESVYIRSMNREHDALLTGMIYGGMSAEDALRLLAKERTDFSLYGYRKLSLKAINKILIVRDAMPHPPLL